VPCSDDRRSRSKYTRLSLCAIYFVINAAIYERYVFLDTRYLFHVLVGPNDYLEKEKKCLAGTRRVA